MKVYVFYLLAKKQLKLLKKRYGRGARNRTQPGMRKHSGHSENARGHAGKAASFRSVVITDVAEPGSVHKRKKSNR